MKNRNFAVFIWCDIDGEGKSWRLAVPRRMEDNDEDGLYFPFEDFHDEADGYSNYPHLPVKSPPPLKE